MIRLPRYLASALLALFVTLVAYLIAPVLPLFADAEGNLPRWLHWFQTPDNPIWGDSSFASREAIGMSRYRRSVAWLWRNPAQGLDSWLGAVYPSGVRPKVCGNPRVSDVWGISGWCWVTLDGYFSFTAVMPIGFGRCITCGFGWRLQQIALDYNGGMANPMTRQLVYSARFFRFGA
jgi:hypothetical protein